MITECCPVLWQSEFAQVIHAHVWNDKGVLPHEGGWADQPAVLMGLAGIFSQEVSQCQKT